MPDSPSDQRAKNQGDTLAAQPSSANFYRERLTLAEYHRLFRRGCSLRVHQPDTRILTCQTGPRTKGDGGLHHRGSYRSLECSEDESEDEQSRERSERGEDHTGTRPAKEAEADPVIDLRLSATPHVKLGPCPRQLTLNLTSAYTDTFRLSFGSFHWI